MELTMTNSFGFCELNENEMMMIDGGVSIEGIKIIAGCAAIGFIGGAATGTLAGAVAGSAIPVVGTALGAIIGGLGGGATGMLAGVATGVYLADYLEM